jgi:hypothetical protein
LQRAEEMQKFNSRAIPARILLASPSATVLSKRLEEQKKKKPEEAPE